MVRTRVGYAGGAKKEPTYRSLGDHTESFQVDYDPSKITYGQLLAMFWDGHEPTDAAYSKQYAAILFVADDEQEAAARASLAAEQKEHTKAIRTPIVRTFTFWPAEDYHQKYALRGDPLLAAELKAIYPNPVDFRESTAAARLNGYLAGDGSLKQLEREIDSLGLSEGAAKRLRDRVKAHGGGGGSCPVR